LIIASIFYLTPIYLLIITGLKSFKEIGPETMWNLPKGFYLDSFYQALIGDNLSGKTGLINNFKNSLILVIPGTIISSFVGSINGYILSKWKFKYSELIFVFILFGMFIPYQSILIPLVQVLQKVGLYGSISGLVVIHIIYGIPITTLIFRNYYNSIPYELIEAGRIDGTSVFNAYYYLILPISIPAFVVVAMWQFTTIWNEFLFATVVTSNPKTQPVTVALNNLAGSHIVEWNVQMAGAFLVALPTLLLYVILQKYFIKGLLSGSLKE
jgi:glucose/mannose transport system permease protein